MIMIEMISMTITMETIIIIMIENINDKDRNDINDDNYCDNNYNNDWKYQW